PGAWIALPEFSLGTEQIVQHRHGVDVGQTFIRDGLPEDVKEYWATRNLHAHYAAFRRECFDDTTPPPEHWYQLSTALGHITPDFTEVLRDGLDAVIDRADAHLQQAREDDPEGAQFLRAAIIGCQGAKAFAARFGVLAGQLADDENDPHRAAELRQMAQRLPELMATGARSYWEALQSVWLCHQVMHIEGNSWSMSPGRVDQILWPHYEADIATGALTRERALELTQCFLIKFKENTVFGPRGNPTQCITLGGSDAEGNDQTNDLTYLFLEAAGELRLPEPLVNLRWNRSIPDELMRAALDCVAGGLNMPVFLNDEASPKGFINLGIDPDDAYDYTHVGCGELGIPGKLQDSALGGSTGHVHALMQTLWGPRNSGERLSETYPTFDAFLATLGESMRRNAERSAAVAREIGQMHERHGQIPFTSALMSGCIERARDLTVRADYNFPSMNMPGGFANFVNSVASIRRLVYQEQTCDLDTLMDAMAEDFDGYEELRAEARRAPKFGND
ncbi:MAG TPA: pyruvate formate lyase family protein, partial [Armatimonadota bacterium]|nr:pyruvate formate lyase family protein [Armatimonadota bacterium]